MICRCLAALAGLVAVVVSSDALAAEVPVPPLRPPSVPLVAHDPYFSLWSPADRLTDADTTHWTGTPQRLRGLVRVDGRAYRLIGTEPKDQPALPQLGLEVLPTRTLYTFGDDRVEVRLSFITPGLPERLDVLARPVTYIVWDVRSRDGQEHAVQLLFGCGAEVAVNTPDQPVAWTRPACAGLEVLRIGTVEQPVLMRQGDNLRIDWGHAYLAAESASRPTARLSPPDAALGEFVRSGALPAQDDARAQAAPRDGAAAMNLAWDLGRVGAEPVTRRALIAYDDVKSIRYFEADLEPYWRHHIKSAEALLATAAREADALIGDCARFDRVLMDDLRAQGGERYARIAALAYRQTLAGCKLAADRQGKPLFFPKENFSNGCIGTVDVIYPMMPFTLLFSPALAKGLIVPVLDYAASPRWKFAYAPHDLGRYPHATGQVYGGGEKTDDRQMPVEESANMLILLAAVARVDGDARFAEKYWPLLVKWAEYLEVKGFDPENQLCTDDFAGHLAHNVNLSAKTICALGAFADLCRRKGDAAAETKYRTLARRFAGRWVAEAADGDHYRLAFDRPGTWSQKYNLVWDRLLGLNLFPPEVVRTEMDFYRKTQRKFGLPLDSRETYTKLDWIVWTATTTGVGADLDALIGPIYDFLNATPDRVPMTDWYFTDTGRLRGFIARPVVGGVFVPMVGDLRRWDHWSHRGADDRGPWAPAPIFAWKSLAATAERAPEAWKHREADTPPEGWQTPEYDDASWSESPGAFGGGRELAGDSPRTAWSGKPILLRRTFTLGGETPRHLRLRIGYAGRTEVYVNGVLAARLLGDARGYQNVKISEDAVRSLHPGKNLLAVSSRAATNPKATRFIDVGLIDLDME